MGSGKSNFANKLGKILNRSIIHLDKEYFNSDWTEKYTKEEWVNFQKDLLEQNEWIIDGNYKSTLDLRMEAADTIIYFDFPKLFCLYRSFKRILDRTQPFDKPKGMKEKVGLELIKFILKYPKKEMRKKLKEYSKDKQIIVFKTPKEAKIFLDSL